MNNLTLRTLTSPYVNDVTRGSVLSQADVDNNFIFLKGNIIYTAETIGNIVTLKRFNGDDLSFIAGETFTGGTISGATNFTGGLTADTFSATTYLGLPQDIYVTGFTYDNANNFTIKQNGYADLTTTINTMTGLTMNGNINMSNNAIYTNSAEDTAIYFGNEIVLTQAIDTPTGWYSSLTVTPGSITSQSVYQNQTSQIHSLGTNNFLQVASGTSLSTLYQSYDKFLITTSSHKGIEYNGDYSASFTNNTLITKLYVDSVVSAKTDVYVTGGTYSNGSLTYTNNTGGTFNVYGSTTYAAGVISGASGWSKVVPNNGQINLPAIKVALFNNANNIEPVIVYDVASGTTGVGAIPSLTDNDTNYVVVEYNGGSPRYYVYDNDGVVDDSSTVLYMIIYRLGNFVHTLEFGNQGAGLANKLNDRFIMTNRFGYESGLSIGLSGTGVVTLSAGVAWNGTNRQVLNQCDSSGNTFFKNYHVGGSWTATTTGKTLNNSYYDNGTNIVSGTTGKYLTNWYFRGQEINDHLYEVYGINEYDSVSLAEASSEPLVPELVSSHAFLVGRIIVGVGETTGQTQTSFGVVFQPSGNFSSTSVHNDLTGLQGGLGGQYYHLNSNQYNNLSLTNSVNNFTTGQTFSGGLSATTISATTYYGLPSGPISVINTSSLFSTGLVNSGYQASGVSNSNFFGNYAGYQASNASYSNFMGLSAGTFATNAEQSNFFGFRSGYGATDANSSNFMGSSSGYEATNAQQSNFFGVSAGWRASGAAESNFFGSVAGYQAYDAADSNFIGQSAGYQAYRAFASNFIGYGAGRLATDAFRSNFIGQSAGDKASGASASNFFGLSAGSAASGATQSNFIGTIAGGQATDASYSNFMGYYVGYQASGSSSSNFMGYQAGYRAYDAAVSNFIGYQAGQSATGATYSNFMGYQSGWLASNASESNFIGTSAGYQASGATKSNFIGKQSGWQATGATQSNFFGFFTGYRAYNASNSNFMGYSAGYGATNGSDSNFFGQSAGFQATGANNSNFMGQQAGYQATGATNSNFIGYNSGFQAYDASYSNIFGQGAGNGATNANHSNFIGQQAGYLATGATQSNFFGTNSGYQAYDASYSNFMGNGAGNGATGAFYSTFMGVNAGQGATGASNSNFFGWNSGFQATNALDSNFMGNSAGQGASGATISNFIGKQAGYGATGASQSNFMGNSAGIQATNAIQSNFIGTSAGYQATGASASNFMGYQSGYQATGAFYSNFIGAQAGTFATNANTSNFIGYSAGQSASNANNSNFLGNSAGNGATNAPYSNFIGSSSGYQASGAGESNFIGYSAGYKAYSAAYSTFIGSSAGREANGATFANFMGRAAGYSASGATYSTFIGHYAGYFASGAYQSNFIGNDAGNRATNAIYSNFIGYSAGQSASNASYSNFIGVSAGFRATGATNSNLFGYNVGYSTITSDSIGSNNIIIGTNITLSAGTVDSINIGGVLFGTGTYSITGGSASLTVVPSGKIGIGVIAPTERLHVRGNLLVDGNLTFTGQSRNPIYSAGTVTATHIPNWNNSNIQTVILSAATTSISGGTNIQNGAVYTMILKQNASGSRVVTWGSEYKWQSGIAPVLSSTANAVDIITLISDGTSLYGLIAKDFR